MSMLLSSDLQGAVFGLLAADNGLAALVGTAIFDAPPDGSPGGLPQDYVTIGEETVRANDTKTSRGAVHDFDVTVHSRREGFDTAKRIAGAVCAVLVDASPALDGGSLVALRLLRARATRGPSPEKRQVALRFRAVIEEN